MHHRWPAAALAALAAGIALLPDPRLAILAPALAAAAALAFRKPVLLLAALFCVAGTLRATVEDHLVRRDPLQGQDGQEIEVRGMVLEAPRQRSWGSAFLLETEGGATILVERRGDDAVRPGERWRFHGRLRPFRRPRFPGGFDMGAWLGRQGVHHRLQAEDGALLGEPAGWTPQALAWRLRAWLDRSLQPFLTPDAHALLTGIMLGESRGLPPDLQEAFRRTGTSHLLAASGLNIAVIAGLVLWVGRRLELSLRRTAPPALLAIGFYALLAGSSPSVTRAAAMAAVGLLAVLVGRRADVIHSLLMAGIALLLVRPFWLFDVGFQLSMAAVGGILAFTEPLERRLYTLPRTLRTPLALSTAASLAVAPLLAWHFQELSAMSVVANLLMTPVAELLLPVGFATAGIAGLVPPAASLPAAATQLALDYLIAVATAMAALADPVRVTRPEPAALAGFAAGAVWLRWWLAGEASRRQRVAVAAAALLLLASAAAPSLPTKRLTIRMPDLREPVLWVTTPAGRHLLLLETLEQRAGAEEMLALHGVLGADRLYVLGSTDVGEVEPGLRLDRGEGWMALAHGGFVLLWADATAKALPPAAVALLPRQIEPPDPPPSLTLWPGRPPRRAWQQAGRWWSTDRDGPVEIVTDGAEASWRPWR